MSAVGSPGARPPRGLSVDHARLKMLARLMALAAVAPQAVAGQELFITTSTRVWADSGGSVHVQLVSSAGAVKASEILERVARNKGALVTWNANGAGFEAGDQIRFGWSSGDGWHLIGLSLAGFTLQGRSPPFWMDSDRCGGCNVQVACSGAGAVQWTPGVCYSQLQCTGDECATRRVWTLRDLPSPPTPPPSPSPSPPPSPPS